jgi:hypothetical protein
MTGSIKRRLAELLMSHAAGRLRGERPEWAAAMMSESAALGCDEDRVRWSAGCAVASYRAPGAFNGAIYPAALACGIALMGAYQWSTDESLGTVAVLSLIGLALGALQPRRNLTSGVAIGLVVAAVNSFETITGMRPAYETAAHSLLHDARWIVLIAPGLIASVVGGYAGRKLRSESGATS